MVRRHPSGRVVGESSRSCFEEERDHRKRRKTILGKAIESFMAASEGSATTA